MTTASTQEWAVTHYRVTPGTYLSRDPDNGSPVATLANSKSFRLGGDLGHLCELVASDASAPSATALLAKLGPDWDTESVSRGLAALTGAGIVADAQRVDELEAAGARPSRFAFRAPFSLQWNLADPAGFCRRLRPVAPLLRGRTGLILSTIGAAIQVFALVRNPLPALSSLGPVQFALVGFALLVLVAIHELAHGTVLSAAGGRPRRLGFMLYYLTPGFFCDVSDSWRLGRRTRIDVALAGVASQCQVGALAALPLLLGAPGASALVWLMVFNLACAATNLLPLLKLDGYLALMAAVGIPNLRSRAMGAWRDTLRRLAGLPTEE
ncbi:MAG: hypothetical protein LBU05_03930, partial [Bifidobacteriaceae bacterium]|nr:hypothetical protein [Bifidobacteriaceae bacterium]